MNPITEHKIVWLEKITLQPHYELHQGPHHGHFPLRTNFNDNGSVRWRTSVYLNLFHWPMGKKIIILESM